MCLERKYFSDFNSANYCNKRFGNYVRLDPKFTQYVTTIHCFVEYVYFMSNMLTERNCQNTHITIERTNTSFLVRVVQICICTHCRCVCLLMFLSVCQNIRQNTVYTCIIYRPLKNTVYPYNLLVILLFRTRLIEYFVSVEIFTTFFDKIKKMAASLSLDERKFAIGQMVYTKITGYPPWPSCISSSREMQAVVRYFGWKNEVYVILDIISLVNDFAQATMDFSNIHIYPISNLNHFLLSA